MITDTKYIINKTNILELAMSVYCYFECRKNIVASNKFVENQDFTLNLYTNIVSEKLLELTIKIRILLYQGHEFDPKNDYRLVGSYEEIAENKESSTWEEKVFN